LARSLDSMYIILQAIRIGVRHDGLVIGFTLHSNGVGISSKYGCKGRIHLLDGWIVALV
jgi:hypothetical protein